MTGELYFPNIYLEKSEINFGCILNNTEMIKHIQMTNISPLIVHYKWKFLLERDNVVSNNLVIMNTNRSLNDQDDGSVDFETETKTQNALEKQNSLININSNEQLDSNGQDRVFDKVDETRNINLNENGPVHTDNDVIMYQNGEIVSNEPSGNTKELSFKLNDQNGKHFKKTYKIEEILSKNNEIDLPSIEEIFDISPLYGSLHPGESQRLTVTYFGHKEIKAYVKAFCEIKNGPEYELLLKGEASVLNYELSERKIDLGYVV